MRKILTMAAVVGVTVSGLVTLSVAAGPSPDDTIKKVMKAAMKGGLCKAVASGKADSAQKEELLKLFKDMANAEPPEGDKASWEAKTKALVAAAQAAVDGKEGAGGILGKAANCKACHDVHKGK
ncbi:MAG: hypothetical protein U0835_04105 [Isosphaeraceae bacterium]